MNYAKVLLDLYRLKQNEKKSSAQMNAVQDKKLQRILHFAWEHSEYYHHAFTEGGITIDQISKLPLAAFPAIDKGMENDEDAWNQMLPGIIRGRFMEYDNAADYKTADWQA